MNTDIRDKVYERLNYYSDRFSELGPCGAKTIGCKDECVTTRRHFTDKNLYHNYASFYADLMGSLVREESEFSLLELGISRGGSVASWCEAMPKAFICGVDKDLSLMWIDPSNYSNLTVVSGMHGNSQTYTTISDRKFDVIIDDGSHKSSEQIENFAVLKNLLKKGGVYIIEDVYPENTYQQDFLSQFELKDFSVTSGRFDDRILVYVRK